MGSYGHGWLAGTPWRLLGPQGGTFRPPGVLGTYDVQRFSGTWGHFSVNPAVRNGPRHVEATFGLQWPRYSWRLQPSKLSKLEIVDDLAILKA